MSRTLFQILDLENPVLRSYLLWSSVLIVKTMAMSMLTAFHRFKNGVFANPEDTITKGSKVKYDQPDIERVRRAHRNDLENVIPFILVAFFYTLTDPSVFLATNLFRFATIGRCIHTFAYAVFVLPQPTRAIAFGVPAFITIYMAVVTILTFI